MQYTVEFSAAAAEDLQELFDFVLQRELDSAAGDLDTAALVETLRRAGAYLPQDTLSRAMTRTKA